MTTGAQAGRSDRYPSAIAIFIACSTLAVLACGRQYLATPYPTNGFLRELLGWLTCYYPWIVLAPVVFRLETRFPLGKRNWAKHLFVLACASVLFGYVATEFATVLNLALQLALREPLRVAISWWRPAFMEILLQQGIYAVAIAAAYLFRRARHLHEQEQRAVQLALEKSELESSLRRAELETLRMRLNPHFLFNSLQNVSVLAQQDARAASQMLTRLGDLLRVALRRDAGPETTLETEIALTQAYIAIEKMRFGDRISVLFNMASGTGRALVPTFLLQPLVENAIKHGLAGTRSAGLIAIGSAERNGELILTVRDNGIGIPSQNVTDLDLGVGLSSTCDRLARMFPSQHQFSITALPEGGTEVRIALPFRTTPSQESTYAEASSTNR